MKRKPVFIIIAVIVFLVLAAGGTYGYLYAVTPAHIRSPAYEHYHVRTQLIVDGQAVDFSQDKFQREYDGNSCSVELSKEPIHFHDNIDQITHIHWDGMTGGEVLKFYGWNFVGGGDGILGWHFGESILPRQVRTYGRPLPDIPADANFYIYTGDDSGYEQKKWQDFLNMDLEDFFGKQSNIKQDGSSSGFNVFDLLAAKAYAHGDALDSHDETEVSGKTEEELTRINNLIGNVVIFVQETDPTEEQIQERFDNLVPLQDSACGG